MRFATRTLSPSVITVVAAFIPLAGCADEHDPHVVGNPPICGNTPGDISGCIPDLRSQPDAGVARDSGVARDATSRDAVTPDLTCPSVEPGYGQSCKLPNTSHCEYGSITACGFRERSMYCADGRWQSSVSSCNPPYVPCPTAEPMEGASCEQGLGPPSCGYRTCDDGGAQTYACSSGSWVVTQRCSDTTCPSTRPSHGAACAYAGDDCEYDPCGSVFSTKARCQAGSWQLSVVSCNPPPPPLCPGPTPVHGADCQHATGSSCYVVLDGGAPIAADCLNGKWQVRYPDAGG